MKKCKWIRLFLILFIVIINYQSSVNNFISSPYHATLTIVEKKTETTFFLNNITEHLGIGALGISMPFVGETWNLTVKIDANSTSGIKVL